MQSQSHSEMHSQSQDLGDSEDLLLNINFKSDDEEQQHRHQPPPTSSLFDKEEENDNNSSYSSRSEEAMNPFASADRRKKQQAPKTIVSTVGLNDDEEDELKQSIIGSDSNNNRSYGTTAYTSFPRRQQRPSATGSSSQSVASEKSSLVTATSASQARTGLTASRPESGGSLFDDNDSTSTSATANNTAMMNPLTDYNDTTLIPGVAGFLEIEEEPPRGSIHNQYDNSFPSSSLLSSNSNHNRPTAAASSASSGGSIRTSSGLILTHRKTPNETYNHNNRQRNQEYSNSVYAKNKNNAGAFEMEVPWFNKRLDQNYFASKNLNTNPHSNFLHSNSSPISTFFEATRLLSYARLWVIFFCLVLLMGTFVIVKNFRHELPELDTQITNKHDSNSGNYMANGNNNNNYYTDQHGTHIKEQIFLLPLPNAAEQLAAAAEQFQSHQHQHQHQHRQTTTTGTLNNPSNTRRLLTTDGRDPTTTTTNHNHHSTNSNGNDETFMGHMKHQFHDLRNEFEGWVEQHGKKYHSDDEKQKRFNIWIDNHHRTIEKNEKHGKCKLTKAPVFGSNQFKDLTPQEFQSQFLTGYNGPTTDGLPVNTTSKVRSTPFRPTSAGSGTVLGNHIPVKRHPTIHDWVLEQHRRKMVGSSSPYGTYSKKSSTCSWYDISCMVRWIFNTYMYYGIGTMEPAYDSESYPMAMDWRDVGAVTDVRRQGDCGACWAITAVETVESAYYISTGVLVDLEESEVIVCTESCNMCYGGWPQDALEFVMEQKGLYEDDGSWSYDADTLLQLSEAKEGNSDQMNGNTVEEYMASYCPNGGGGGSGSGSQDNGDNNSDGSRTRYGNIKGYGYATDRCVCYSDGSGCDCDDQNEGLAVRNVATYGPATVCLDASTWQDYGGGIMTSDSGCSSAFLDMNHCVQVVGYAFNEVSEEGEGRNSGSGSGSNDGGGSNDNSQREGYWIVRNQWSNNWGMNGFAYVAMGDNTCGILNDMTQAYM